jgi:hypothetical protein
MKIEDYGLIGDLQTAALVGRNGSPVRRAPIHRKDEESSRI